MNATLNRYANQTLRKKYPLFLFLLLAAPTHLTQCAEQKPPARRVHFYENPKPFAVPHQKKQVYPGRNFDKESTRNEKLAAIQTWIEFDYDLKPYELLEQMIQPNQRRLDRIRAIENGLLILLHHYPEKYNQFINFCTEYCANKQLLDQSILQKTPAQKYNELKKIDFFKKLKPFEDVVNAFLDMYGQSFARAQEDVVQQAVLKDQPTGHVALETPPAVPPTPKPAPSFKYSVNKYRNKYAFQELLAAELISALLYFVWE